VFKKLLRVMPAYVLTLIFYSSVFLHLRSGPKWVLNDEYTALCKNMWRSLLFVDNFVNNGRTICMPWGFYLQL
jgi:peptidoglycan/LPS O-acetylase OafA/YrhL